MAYNSEDYFRSKDFKNILKQYEEAEKHDTYAMLDSDELVDVAEYYYNNGNAQRASEIIEEALSIYPGSAAPLLFKARLELIEHNNVEQAEYFTEMIEDKSDLEYFYMKAEILLAQGLVKQADAYLEERYSDVDDEDKDFYAIDVAALFIDYDSVNEAEMWLAKSEDTESVEYKEQAARIFMERGDYEKSKELFNNLIDNDPFSTQYWNSLASAQFFSNNIEESIQSSEYSIAINPQNATALLNKANGLYNLGNYTEALKYYLRYSELCPTDENGEMLIGFCYLLLDKFEESTIHFKKAERLSAPQSPNLVDIYKDWAFALCRLNRIDESMKIMDKTDHLSCDHNEMLVYRGNLLIGNGHFLEAKKYFMQAMKESGYSPNIFTKIAITVFESGDNILAYKMFGMLFKSNINWHDGYAYYAACCYSLCKWDEFLNNLDKAVRYTPQDAKLVLGKLFPKNMDPKDYYQYMSDKIKNEDK